ncbi:MAG: hydrogen gas-evolving membrane-bound hydrogenase subunit E [Chloroflexota bacterium]
MSLLIASPLVWVLRPHQYPKAGWYLALIPTAITGWLLSQMAAISHAHPLTERYPWASELGLELAFRLDGLSLFFGLIIAGIGAGITLYTAYYLENDRRMGYFYGLLFAFMASMLGLVWADNLLTLFVFWEGTSITSYLLVGYKHESAEAQDGARRALIVTGSGGLAMLAGFILLAQAAGSYTLSDILTTPHLVDHALYPTALILILVGAFTKSAQFPFQFWLPGAMAAPTPASAYLHSATMVKAGIYLLARLHPALSHSDLWFWLLFSFGGITMLLGAISALRYYDLKRILAYATVSQLGILVLLLAFEGEIAYGAVVVGIISHALYKGPLFMIAGIVDHATGTRDIRRLADLARSMPWVAVAASIACFSMAGFPPFFGFLAKETLLETLYHHAEAHPTTMDGMMSWVAYGGAAVAGAFFVAYSLTLLIETFFRKEAPALNMAEKEHDGEPVEAAHVHHAPSFGIYFAPLLLATLGLLLPLVIGPIQELLLSPPASSIAGETLHLHLKLWHGFNFVFQTSLVVIGSGVGIYFLRAPLRRLLQLPPEWLSGVAGFNQVYNGSYALARWSTRLVQGGTLASQASVILLAAVGFVLYALFQSPLSDIIRIDITNLPRFHELSMAVLAVIAAIVTVRSESRLNAIISIGVVGVVVTLFFIYFGAPDLALTQLLIEVLTVVLLVLVFYRIPPETLPPKTPMTIRRNVLVASLVGSLGFVLVLIAGGTPHASSITDFFKLNSVPAAHGGNVVNVILVDFRGFDTLGEITVLAIAALGGYALLRASRLRAIEDLQPTEEREK